MSYKTEST